MQLIKVDNVGGGICRHCVTGSLDGKLIIWDTWTGNKIQVNEKNIIEFKKIRLLKLGYSVTLFVGDERCVCRFGKLCW